VERKQEKGEEKKGKEDDKEEGKEGGESKSGSMLPYYTGYGRNITQVNMTYPMQCTQRFPTLAVAHIHITP